jgi:hypothetical protein
MMKGWTGTVRPSVNKRTEELISRIYDNVHIALWAGLFAFVLFFAVMVAPKIPELRAKAESERALSISAEYNFYCAKFGMQADTPAYRQCILDLQAFRAKVLNRSADEAGFLGIRHVRVTPDSDRKAAESGSALITTNLLAGA